MIAVRFLAQYIHCSIAFFPLFPVASIPSCYSPLPLFHPSVSYRLRLIAIPPVEARLHIRVPYLPFHSSHYPPDTPSRCQLLHFHDQFADFSFRRLFTAF